LTVARIQLTTTPSRTAQRADDLWGDLQHLGGVRRAVTDQALEVAIRANDARIEQDTPDTPAGRHGLVEGALALDGQIGSRGSDAS